MFGTTQKLFGISKERPLVTQGNNEFLNGNFQESVKTLVIAFNRSIGNPSTNFVASTGRFDTQSTLEIAVAGDQVANRNQFPAHIVPEIGQQIQLAGPHNQPILVKVVDISGDSILLDANPPLAGRDLTFDLELVSIAD